jgi:hypothetical protein
MDVKKHDLQEVTDFLADIGQESGHDPELNRNIPLGTAENLANTLEESGEVSAEARDFLAEIVATGELDQRENVDVSPDL